MSALMWTNSGTRMCSMLTSDPVSRLSTQITRWPRRSSSSHRCDPRKPAPPVTRQVAIGVLAYGLRLRHGLRAAARSGARGGPRRPPGCPPRRGAWSPATAIYTGARAAAARASPATRRATASASCPGPAADAPLLLLLRDGVASDARRRRSSRGTPPSRSPGASRRSRRARRSARAPAPPPAGDGAGAIVVRFRVDGADTLSALVRDAGDRFGEAATIVPGDFDRLSDPVVSISQAGTDRRRLHRDPRQRAPRRVRRPAVRRRVRQGARPLAHRRRADHEPPSGRARPASSPGRDPAAPS